jgi:hypothetical protein
MFGEGLVRSVDNFGHLGERPSHRELLDTLAVEFVENGWSTKWLVRRIALTRSYAMASSYQETSFNKDPDNRWLWRANRKRITAESLRDSLLKISGDLDLTPDDSPVAELGALAIDNSSQNSSGRRTDALKRSLYLPIVRNELPGFLTTFDFADPDIVTGRRPETNVPAQAMYLMNNSFVKEQASKVAEQLLKDVENADTHFNDAVCDAAFRRFLARTPNANEQNAIKEYVVSRSGESPKVVWADVIQSIFASTEFRMLE